MACAGFGPVGAWHARDPYGVVFDATDRGIFVGVEPGVAWPLKAPPVSLKLLEIPKRPH